MNFLVLINAAPFHRPFFARVGAALERAGHRVHYAVDSHYTDYLYPDVPLAPAQTTYFSEQFEVDLHKPPRGIPPALANTRLWPTLFSDLDRAVAAPTGFRNAAHYYERLLESLLWFFWELCERLEIDRVVYEPVSNAFAHTAYRVIRAQGGDFIGFMSSRIPGRTDVLDSEFMINSRTESRYQSLLSGGMTYSRDVRAFVSEYISNFDVKRPDYMDQLNYLLENPIKTYWSIERGRTFYRSLRYLVGVGRRHLYTFQQGNPAVVFPRQVLMELLRFGKVHYLGHALYKQPRLDVPYFLYPLQFHPESSTSINALHFVDELSNVRNIAVNLPVGIRLYVKDHPHGAGRERIALYRAIARLPNVDLIDPRFDGKTLVRRARAVVTCTSTMGYEAIMFGVPVFTLGDTLWDFYPGNVRLRSFEHAFEAFAAHDTVRATREQLEAFVGAYYLSTVEGVYDLKRTHADVAFAERVADLLGHRDATAALLRPSDAH